MGETKNRAARASAIPVVSETCRIIEPPSLEEMPLNRRLGDIEFAALRRKAAEFEAFVLRGDSPAAGQTP